MSSPAPDSTDIEAVRTFSRFYTRRLDVLREHLLGGPFSLVEARIVFELAAFDAPTARALADTLQLDPSYLSRTLRSLEQRGFIERRRSSKDGREWLLALTEDGREGLAELERRSRAQVAALLAPLDATSRRQLLGSMQQVERLLTDSVGPHAGWLLRPHRPGDIGWVIGRHGALYAEEYGWDATFEAMVADIASQFIRNFNPSRECCWIAERDGENIGSAFVVQQSDSVAKLRLVLVEPSARGLGVGHRLVGACIEFARRAGYRSMTLWTNDNLHAARRIYEAAGFVLVNEEAHHSFGVDLVGQIWTLDFELKSDSGRDALNSARETAP